MEMKQLLHELIGDMSQAEFGAKIGMTQAAVSALLLGKRSVGIKALRGLIRAFPDREEALMAAFFASDHPYSSSTTPERVSDRVEEGTWEE